MKSAADESKLCPVCSTRLEPDGLCLVCLLNEGIEAREEPGAPANLAGRMLSLPCEFAGHRLVREIASGGMGIVYEAEDLKLRRVVALKVIRNAHFATREEAARFQAETLAAAQLDHPCIVPIYERGEAEGLPYFTMRLAEGGSLATRLKQQGAMPVREAAEMLMRVARAVQFAHDHGVLHRDLKPANILLDAAGAPMLTDFGLAKRLDEAMQLTRSQAHVGTPHYMSPEQAGGHAKSITIASDVWALGVMLCETLTGWLPFQGESAVEVMRRITLAEPDLGSRGRVSSGVINKLPRDLMTLVRRCLEKQTSKRLSSAGFLADELERYLNGEPILSRHVGSGEWLWKFALRHKAAALGVLGISVSLIAGSVVSLWQASRALTAEQSALKQKAESDEIASIVLATVRSTVGKDLDSDEMQDQLLRRVVAFHGDPGRKAAMLIDLSALMRKPTDIQVFRQVLGELESHLKADDPLLWSLRYRVALKTMHSSDAAATEWSEARAELRRVLAWQMAHLEVADTQIYKTKYALAEELLDEVGTPEALREAEELLRSCVAHYQQKRDTYDLITTNIELMSAVFDQGRHEEALKLGHETCELALQKEGERRSITGRVFGRLAKHCREAGLIDESIKHARHALDIYWHTVGPDYVKANATLDGLAGTLEKKGDREAVLQLRRDCLLVCDQQLGTMSPDTQWQAAKAVEAMRELHRFQEAHALAELWLDRVRVDGHLPPGAASLLSFDFLTLWDLDRHGEAEDLLKHLPGMLKAQRWSESAYYLLKRWQAVAARLNKAGRPSECSMIAKHVIQVIDGGSITGRKALGLRPEFEELLHEADAAQTKAAPAAANLPAPPQAQ